MRTIVCLALLAIVMILGLPLLQEMAVQFGWSDSYEDPMRTISAAADNARSIGNNPDFEYLLAFVGGMTFATLLNAFLGRTEKRRSKNYALLGDKVLRLAHSIQAEMESVSRRRDHPPPPLLGEVNSLMEDLKEAGIPVPVPLKGTEVDRWLELAGVYFSHVGPLLRSARINKARRIAGPVQMRLESS